MNTQIQCWRCGATLEDVLLSPGRRVARTAECPQCRAALHVCLACEFYDTAVAKQCRETIAEEVKDKQRANFCDYFQYRADAYRPQDDSAARAARDQLEALFGGAQSVPTVEAGAEDKTEQQRAREALESLFGKPDK